MRQRQLDARPAVACTHVDAIEGSRTHANADFTCTRLRHRQILHEMEIFGRAELFEQDGAHNDSYSVSFDLKIETRLPLRCRVPGPGRSVYGFASSGNADDRVPDLTCSSGDFRSRYRSIRFSGTGGQAA